MEPVKIPLSVVHNHWPICVAISLFLVIVATLLYASLTKTDGTFVYALDDPYIHMAIAKNFSLYGVWGVTRHEFASATSSVGWTALLSLFYFLTGIHDVTPFLTNIGIAIAFLIVLSNLMREFNLSNLTVCILLVTIVVFTPLYVLVFNGMEHMLHASVTVLFLLFAMRLISSDGQIGSRPAILACLLLSVFIILLRFEGIFAVASVGIFLLVRKKIVLALLIGMLSILPIVVYQFLAASKGWYWLPNPIVIRAGISDAAMTASVDSSPSLVTKVVNMVAKYPVAVVQNVERSPELAVLVAVAVVLYFWITVRNKPGLHKNRVLISLFVGMTLLHLSLGKTGHFFRYEAYLITTGLTAIVPTMSGALLSDAVSGWKPWIRFRHVLVLMGMIAPLYFLSERAVKSSVLLPQAAKNIYEQQYQMAMFVKQYYQGSVVALNDVGAVNYYADISCLDLVGLASIDVLKRRIANIYTTQEIDNLVRAKQVHIAIVYDHWFGRSRTGKLPAEWHKIGQWTIKNNVVAGGDTVSFYSVDPAYDENLIRNLQDYSPKLPRDVIQTGLYTLGLRVPS